MVVLLLIV